MLLHGYLAYYSNDAVEAVNGEMAVLYHKHGQKGGSGGRGRGRRTVKHVESMAMHCARKVLWASGEAQAALDQVNAAKEGNRKRPHMAGEEGRAKRFCGGRKSVGRAQSGEHSGVPGAPHALGPPGPAPPPAHPARAGGYQQPGVARHGRRLVVFFKLQGSAAFSLLFCVAFFACCGKTNPEIGSACEATALS